MKRADIVAEARKLVGAPWVHQGRDPIAGIDCLGVLMHICKKFNIEVEDNTTYSREPDGITIVNELRKYMDEVPVESAKEGDVLVFRMPAEVYPRHVGILTKGQQEYMLVHSIAGKSGGHTVEETLRRWVRVRTHAFQFRQVED